MSSTERKLPLGVKVGYGTGGASYFIAYNILGLYLIWFFTETVGLSPAFAGLIFSFGVLWDAITDPVIGMWTDNRDLKKGRRRPFLKWVAIPFGLCTWLVFTDFGLSEEMTKVYYVVVMAGYYTCMTVFDIPFTALGAEMTTDYDERSSLAQWRNLMSQAANFLTSLVFFMLPWFIALTGSDKGGWSATFAIFGAVSTFTILIAWRATKGYELTEKDVLVQEKVGLKDYISVLKNKPFRNVVFMYTMSIFANGFLNTILLYFLFFVGGLTEEQVPVGLMIVFGFSILFAPVMKWLAVKTSKKAAWFVGMGSWSITLLLFPLLFIPGASDPVFTSYVMLFFSAIGCTSQFQIAWSMIPDCVELDELQTGHRREGLYYATTTLVQKVMTAVSTALGGFVLSYIGYVNGGSVTPEITTGIQYVFAFGAGIPLGLSALIVLASPMTRARHHALNQAIKLKSQGRSFTTDGFKELFNSQKEIDALTKPTVNEENLFMDKPIPQL